MLRVKVNAIFSYQIYKILIIYKFLLGWYTDSDKLDKIPRYRNDGKIVGYSPIKLPEALTAPEYIVSNSDRDSIVRRGTICGSGKRYSGKGHKKAVYAAIFCDEDSSLEDGTYVFRIHGALSREHPHSMTKWELCGLRGTSDEELTFTMSSGSCHHAMKRSRWEMQESSSLANFFGSLTIQFDDAATIKAMDDLDHNEVILSELEAALLAAVSDPNALTTTVSIDSIVFSDGYLRASFGLHLDPESYLTGAYLTQVGNKEFIIAELQSNSTLSKLLEKLQKYPEFTATSSVTVSEVFNEDDFHAATQQGRQFDATEDDDPPSINTLSVPYVLIVLAAIGAAAILAAIFQVNMNFYE
jgi:hypothetical protein